MSFLDPIKNFFYPTPATVTTNLPKKEPDDQGTLRMQREDSEYVVVGLDEDSMRISPIAEKTQEVKKATAEKVTGQPIRPLTNRASKLPKNMIEIEAPDGRLVRVRKTAELYSHYVLYNEKTYGAVEGVPYGLYGFVKDSNTYSYPKDQYNDEDGCIIS